MKNNLIILAALLSLWSKSQTVTPTVISSNGGSVVLAAGTIDWTIGEIVIDTYTGASNSTTNGFHQPLINLSTFIGESPGSAEIVIYPNPVNKNLQFKISDSKCMEYEVQLHDAAGKLVLSQTLLFQSVHSGAEIDVSGLSNGVYLAQISALKCNLLKTIKILKTN
jgi:hypothetical protein